MRIPGLALAFDKENESSKRLKADNIDSLPAALHSEAADQIHASPVSKNTLSIHKSHPPNAETDTFEVERNDTRLNNEEPCSNSRLSDHPPVSMGFFTGLSDVRKGPTVETAETNDAGYQTNLHDNADEVAKLASSDDMAHALQYSASTDEAIEDNLGPLTAGGNLEPRFDYTSQNTASVLAGPSLNQYQESTRAISRKAAQTDLSKRTKNQIILKSMPHQNVLADEELSLPSQASRVDRLHHTGSGSELVSPNNMAHEIISDITCNSDENLGMVTSIPVEQRKSLHYQATDAANDDKKPTMELVKAKVSANSAADCKVSMQDELIRFPEKLMEILVKEEASGAILWQDEGRSFAIVPELFSSKILRKYFQGCKFESLLRKLNRWGFKRVMDKNAPLAHLTFHHEFFVKGKSELLAQIQGCKKHTNVKKEKVDAEFNFNTNPIPDGHFTDRIGSFLPTMLNPNLLTNHLPRIPQESAVSPRQSNLLQLLLESRIRAENPTIQGSSASRFVINNGASLQRNDLYNLQLLQGAHALGQHNHDELLLRLHAQQMQMRASSSLSALPVHMALQSMQPRTHPNAAGLPSSFPIGLSDRIQQAGVLQQLIDPGNALDKQIEQERLLQVLQEQQRRSRQSPFFQR